MNEVSNNQESEVRTILSKFNSDDERFEWVKKNIMDIQEEADKLPEWDADFAWITNGEIYWLAKDFVSSIKDTKHTLGIVKADLQHEEWPVRIVTSLIEYLISNNIDLENNDLNYPQNNWLDDYRELDPDPTEI